MQGTVEGFLKDVGHELGFERQLEQWWVAGKALEDFSKSKKGMPSTVFSSYSLFEKYLVHKRVFEWSFFLAAFKSLHSSIH